MNSESEGARSRRRKHITTPSTMTMIHAAATPTKALYNLKSRTEEEE